MAASVRSVLGSGATFVLNNTKYCSFCNVHIRNASWSKFFKKSKSVEGDKEESVRKMVPFDGPTTMSRLQTLKKKTSVCSVKGYTPPPDVEQKVVAMAGSIVGAQIDPSYRLDDRLLKFKLLTKLMTEFDHSIPHADLSTMNTVQDVVQFFATPVRDTSSYEDMAKLNLPKNLHIQLEPVRFDPETDTFFDGKTAFPGRPTIVTSLKYSRKYKGNSGQSRNSRSLTNYETRGR
ncbi:large ribosomal subunit protein mL50-like [Physella acuta]|uniref:large ribosomal subunit protein mL50-like n=1 Tax=Physella acuta TaxID=109671 RepID=UPI0027DB2D21|nr:large ribosomal subunit protein mL50-like [Physella acuta]XP_059163208.1 large ribosomal subunit protein mL50-like [Physella acuta]